MAKVDTSEKIKMNMKEWNIPQPTQKYMALIHCSTYNHEQYIEDALKGFVMQKTNFPYCAIVIDDASTDHTADIIRKYAEEYPDTIKPICLKENHMQRRKSREPYFIKWHDSAKYIALCEGDDYWTSPIKLQKQIDLMEANPDVTLCFHNAMFHFEKGISQRFVKERHEDGTPKDYLLNEKMESRFYDFEETYFNWFHATASWLIRREVFESEVYKRMRTIPSPNGDEKLRLTCAKLGRLYGFAEPMSVYRIHSGGISQNIDDHYDKYLITRYYTIKIMNLGKPYIDKLLIDSRNLMGISFHIILHGRKGWQHHLNVLKSLIHHTPKLFLRNLFLYILGIVKRCSCW